MLRVRRGRRREVLYHYVSWEDVEKNMSLCISLDVTKDVKHQLR